MKKLIALKINQFLVKGEDKDKSQVSVIEIENQTPNFRNFVYTKNSNKVHREILPIITKIKSVRGLDSSGS
jgi:hypothetical protein